MDWKRRIPLIAFAVWAVLAATGTWALFLTTWGDQPPALQTSRPDQRIRLLQVDVQVHQDGSMHFRETIDYDFGPLRERGIVRHLASGGDLLAPGRDIEAVHARSDSAAAITVRSYGPNTRNAEEILIESRAPTGRPGWRGVHRFVVDYDYRFGVQSTDPLRLDLVGNGWQVPIDRVVATIDSPAPLSDLRCVAGDPTDRWDHQRECPATSSGEHVVRVEHHGLQPENGIRLTGRYPEGAVMEHHTLRHWLAVVGMVLGSVVLAGLSLLALVIIALSDTPGGGDGPGRTGSGPVEGASIPTGTDLPGSGAGGGGTWS